MAKWMRNRASMAKRLGLAMGIVILFWPADDSFARGKGRSRSGGGGSHYVKPYFRSNGTFVSGHRRSNPAHSGSSGSLAYKQVNPPADTAGTKATTGSRPSRSIPNASPTVVYRIERPAPFPAGVHDSSWAKTRSGLRISPRRQREPEVEEDAVPRDDFEKADTDAQPNRWQSEAAWMQPDPTMSASIALDGSATEFQTGQSLPVQPNRDDCPWGHKPYGDICVPFLPPKYAHLNAFGDDFECNDGYLRYQFSCVPLIEARR